jgi:hypothetical protein
MYKTWEHAAVAFIGRARKYLRMTRRDNTDPADVEFELKFYHCKDSNVCRLILRDVDGEILQHWDGTYGMWDESKGYW